MDEKVKQEITRQLKEMGIYKKVIQEYKDGHIGNIPKSAIQSEFQEMLTKYNIKQDALEELFGI